MVKGLGLMGKGQGQRIDYGKVVSRTAGKGPRTVKDYGKGSRTVKDDQELGLWYRVKDYGKGSNKG